MSSFPNDPIFTNSRLYRDIATEALSASEDAFVQKSRPKDDSSPGHVIAYDPEYRSFKQSMIAIVFAGMYMEARLWLFGCSLLGAAKYRQVDQQPLEQRLAALGIDDQTLEVDLKNYREVRRSLVDEKSVPLSVDTSPTRIAQAEAVKAVQLMYRIEQALTEKET
jgi:hypothetical protein